MTWLPIALAAASAAVLVAGPRAGSARLAGLSAAATSPTGRPLPVGELPVVAALPVLLLLLAGPVAGVLGAGAAVLVHRRRRERQRTAAHDRERAAALDALSLLAVELRTGRSTAEALEAAAAVAVGPTQFALAAAAASVRLGGDVAAALVSADSAVPEALRGLAACWQVCSSAGSGLAAGVERLDEGLRAAEEQRRAVDAELAGPRATAGLLAVLPVAGIGLAAALGAHPLQVLLHTPVGLACLACGLLLDAAGVLWTRRLVAAAVGHA